MKIAVGNSRMDKKWKNREISWKELCQKVSVDEKYASVILVLLAQLMLHRLFPGSLALAATINLLW